MFSSVVLPRRVWTDNSGSYFEVPVLHSESGHMDQLLDYMLEKYHMSSTWMRKLAYGVQQLLQYMDANPHETNSELLFQNFARKLQTGTFDPISGHDPSRLGWQPRTPADTQQIVTLISNFLDTLTSSDAKLVKLNPKVVASGTDARIGECAETYRRKYALLGHLWKPPVDSEGKRRRVKADAGPTVNGEPPAFPDERFEELLDEGFKVGDRINFRDQAITLLLHGGGFRVSEPMHMFVTDVQPDPKNYLAASVRIHHPTLGHAPLDFLNERGVPVRCNRREYLQRKYGLAPRFDIMSKKEAGWKNCVLDGKHYMQPYWFKPEYAERFLYVWLKYMEQVADIPLKYRRHPYAYMNIVREPKGSILSLDKFATSHGRACERIGLVVAKHLGTTPHGHRHSYGRRLDEAELDSSLIMKCMHHANEKSQETYTGRTVQETLDALTAASQRMNSKLR